MLLIGGLTLSTGIMFLAIGAWPIVAFLILDVVIILLAFHLSYRSGRAYEEVTVTPNALTIKRVSPVGPRVGRSTPPVLDAAENSL